MRVLLVAPQPFFTERGTPIAVRLLAETLADHGHAVDLLTYPIGNDVAIDGVTLHRCRGIRGIETVPIGMSLGKLLLDLMLVARFFKLATAGRYDVIHAVEEAVFPALLLRRRHRAAVVYDMDSSLADQLADLGRLPRLLRPLFDRLERTALVRPDAVAAVCEALAARVREVRAPETVFLLNDVPVASHAAPPTIATLRDGVAPGRCIALYVGNLSSYQGIDLLVEAVAELPPDAPVDVVVVGGPDDAVARYRALAESRGVTGRVTFLGPRPLHELGALLQQADILLSPRIKGDNTPLKVFSYMDAGRAILATDLRTHTQVLDEETALLVPPAPAAFAAGLRRLAEDPALRSRLATQAVERVRTRYSMDAFREKVAELYRFLAVQRPSPYKRPTSVADGLGDGQVSPAVQPPRSSKAGAPAD